MAGSVDGWIGAGTDSVPGSRSAGLSACLRVELLLLPFVVDALVCLGPELLLLAILLH